MSGRRDAVELLDAGEPRRGATGRLVVRTRGPGFVEVTRAVQAFVAAQDFSGGLATVFCRHTSASLAIQENADPDVLTDLAGALDRLAPRGVPYVHAAEGPDDMPGHIRAMLTGSSVCVPILGGRLALGTWQGIYLIEHRDRPHARELLVNLAGW